MLPDSKAFSANIKSDDTAPTLQFITAHFPQQEQEHQNISWSSTLTPSTSLVTWAQTCLRINEIYLSLAFHPTSKNIKAPLWEERRGNEMDVKKTTATRDALGSRSTVWLAASVYLLGCPHLIRFQSVTDFFILSLTLSSFSARSASSPIFTIQAWYRSTSSLCRSGP